MVSRNLLKSKRKIKQTISIQNRRWSSPRLPGALCVVCIFYYRALLLGCFVCNRSARGHGGCPVRRRRRRCNRRRRRRRRAWLYPCAFGRGCWFRRGRVLIYMHIYIYRRFHFIFELLFAFIRAATSSCLHRLRGAATSPQIAQVIATAITSVDAVTPPSTSCIVFVNYNR